MKHGLTRVGKIAPEFVIWQQMRSRCNDPNNHAYKDYGGRGISVCAAWQSDFKAFYDHVGPRPNSRYSIDRINNDGNYEPGNVRWATDKQQARNTRRAVWVTYNGQRYIFMDLCELLGVSHESMRPALKKANGDFLNALDSYRRHHSPIKMAWKLAVFRAERKEKRLKKEPRFTIAKPLGNLADLTGCKFGMLTVVRMLGATSYDHPVAEVDCDCGRTGLKRLGTAMVSGSQTSCGCERVSGNIKHGQSATKEYHVWRSMISRCEDKNSPAYLSYGGRGISVCKEWRASFSTFSEDMGKKPSQHHSLDRINNDGNYCKENCRWATRVDQNNNTRHNSMVDIGGISLRLMLVARAVGAQPQRIRQRITRGESGLALLRPRGMTLAEFREFRFNENMFGRVLSRILEERHQPSMDFLQREFINRLTVNTDDATKAGVVV